MKYAAIDIGTNTVLLLIMDHRDGIFYDVVDMSTIVRLGEGLAGSGALLPTAMARTMDALRYYTEVLRSHEVEKVFCVGTAALREAANSEGFREDARRSFGIDIEVINAPDEAYYTYLSVRDDARVSRAAMTVIDIGGGSTEVINGTKKDLIRYISMPLGSVRLTDSFIRHDPPLQEELDAVASHIRRHLSGTAYLDGSHLIGTAGTVTTIASLMMGERYRKEKVHGYVIGRDDLHGMIAACSSVTSGERRTFEGMEPGREDIIIQGMVILREIMDHGGFDSCTVSAAGVRYGVIYEKCGVSGEGRDDRFSLDH